MAFMLLRNEMEALTWFRPIVEMQHVSEDKSKLVVLQPTTGDGRTGICHRYRKYSMESLML